MIASVQSAKVKKDRIDRPGVFEDTVIKEHTLYLKGAGVEKRIVCSNCQLEELTLGYLFWKGYLSSPEDLRILSREESEEETLIEIELLHQDENKPVQDKSTVKSLKESGQLTSFPMDLQSAMAISEEMLSGNELFDKTGALHSCIICSTDGKKRFSAVDLGRHNAIDKAIGEALKDKTDLSECVLFTTGRVPTDMLSKVIAAGIPMMVSRGAVTMQSVHLAQKEGIVLCGFSRGERLNIYSPKDYLTENAKPL